MAQPRAAPRVVSQAATASASQAATASAPLIFLRFFLIEVFYCSQTWAAQNHNKQEQGMPRL
jgi:hypothetical protein